MKKHPASAVKEEGAKDYSSKAAICKNEASSHEGRQQHADSSKDKASTATKDDSSKDKASIAGIDDSSKDKASTATKDDSSKDKASIALKDDSSKSSKDEGSSPRSRSRSTSLNDVRQRQLATSALFAETEAVDDVRQRQLATSFNGRAAIVLLRLGSHPQVDQRWALFNAVGAGLAACTWKKNCMVAFDIPSLGRPAVVPLGAVHVLDDHGDGEYAAVDSLREARKDMAEVGLCV